MDELTEEEYDVANKLLVRHIVSAGEIVRGYYDIQDKVLQEGYSIEEFEYLFDETIKRERKINNK